MPSLLELQRSMRTALLAGSDATSIPVIGGAIDAAARLHIYRNNVLGNLIGALRLTFPAVERLVGADFFAAAASHFISATPPAGADLYEYGAAFPDFLTIFEPAQRLVYLADVARLEWAVNHALHAPIAPALTAAALLGVPDQQQASLRFEPHPSLSLLALTHPAKAIWEAVRNEGAESRASSLAAIDVSAAGDILAVLQSTDGLMLLQLSQTDHAFGCALIGGKCLVDALDLVPSEDAASLLGGFIAHGFFARFDLSEFTRQQPG